MLRLCLQHRRRVQTGSSRLSETAGMPTSLEYHHRPKLLLRPRSVFRGKKNMKSETLWRIREKHSARQRDESDAQSCALQREERRTLKPGRAFLIETRAYSAFTRTSHQSVVNNPHRPSQRCRKHSCITAYRSEFPAGAATAFIPRSPWNVLAN